MSQENVEIVRDYFETVNGGDFARAMRYYTGDVELVVPGGTAGFLEAGRFTGKDAVGLWFGVHEQLDLADLAARDAEEVSGAHARRSALQAVGLSEQDAQADA